MKKAYFTLKDKVTIHSIWDNEFAPSGTVNVPPEHREKTMALLEREGYDILSVEELQETPEFGGDRFTRIQYTE